MTASSQITRSEWRWAIAWSLGVVGLSCLPYLLAWLTAPQGWQFAGILSNPYDAHSYLAKIRQGLAGNWLFHLTYTPEPHEGALVYGFYLALGHVAAWLGLSPVVIFHLARAAAGLALLLIAYRFIAAITLHLAERRLAFILLLTASGLGWLGVILGAFPIDLWVPEAFTPYSLYTNPHFPLAMALMLLIFLNVATSNFQTFKRSTLWAGLCALALALVLPFGLLTVGAVVAVYLAWLWLWQRQFPWPQFWPSLSAGLFSAPVILYDYGTMTANPVLAGWLAQNVTPAPSLLNLGLGYGLVGLLAILGGWMMIRQGRLTTPGEWLVLWWAVTTLVLLYLPFDLQRRLITGLHIPLCILAAIGLQRWLESRQVRPGRARQITLAVITLSLLGTLFVWFIPLLATRQSPDASENSALLFIRDEEAAAFDWLRQNATQDDIILASPRMGMFIPGQTGARVFYGHPFETIAAKEKKAAVEAFYRGQLEQVDPPPHFVIYGPSERALGQPQIPADWPVVFSTEHLIIYETFKR
jgi:hypothetical protein